jgi:hypothetical protein
LTRFDRLAYRFRPDVVVMASPLIQAFLLASILVILIKEKYSGEVIMRVLNVIRLSKPPTHFVRVREVSIIETNGFHFHACQCSFMFK